MSIFLSVGVSPTETFLISSQKRSQVYWQGGYSNLTSISPWSVSPQTVLLLVGVSPTKTIAMVRVPTDKNTKGPMAVVFTAVVCVSTDRSSMVGVNSLAWWPTNQNFILHAP